MVPLVTTYVYICEYTVLAFNNAVSVSGLLTIWHVVALPFVIAFVYYFVRSIYRLYFGPVSSIPGPRLAAITHWYINYHTLHRSGHYCFHVKALHDRYGPMVRLAPNQISFCSASSWKDIYGHVPGRKKFLKSNFYFHEKHPGIVSERDPEKHGLLRKLFSHAFSAKALGEQEYIVATYVDKFIEEVGARFQGPGGGVVTKWFNFLTFDIIGDLAFGEPFGCLRSGRKHYWIEALHGNTKAVMTMTLSRNYPWAAKHRSKMAPKNLVASRKKNIAYAEAVTRKRINTPHTRKDFMTHILSQKEAKGIPFDALASNASTLVIAGSETTVTTLSAVAYYLTRNPHVLSTLCAEVRTAFPNYASITGLGTEHLCYLNAVISEGLRIYPPVPIGMPRLSPGETVDGVYIPAGIEVLTSAFAATHSSCNFHASYEFLPERWIPGSSEYGIDKLHGSQPFLLGSRVCLGRNLALLELRTTLAKLVWLYDIETVEGEEELDWMRDSKNFLLWFKPELHVKLTKRSNVDGPVGVLV